MAVLSWGKPQVEYALLNADGTPGEFRAFPEIVQGTATLEAAEGDLLEAKQEGGERVDARRSASSYTFKLSVFAKKNSTKPIEDTNGIVTGNYALRLTPEDPAAIGFAMARASVSAGESWTAEQGTYWNYTFEGLAPVGGGKIVTIYPTVTPEG